MICWKCLYSFNGLGFQVVRIFIYEFVTFFHTSEKNQRRAEKINRDSEKAKLAVGARYKKYILSSLFLFFI